MVMQMSSCKGKAKVASPLEQKSVWNSKCDASSGPCLEGVRLQVLKKQKFSWGVARAMGPKP